MPDRKVLIVDDDQDLAYALSIRLRSAGYRTAFAHDAISAGLQVRKEMPDVILMDVGLPGGDGFLVMDRLRMSAGASLTPTIVMSARVPAPTKARAMKAGAFAYFRKPADPAALLDAIDNAISGGTPSPGAAR
jgi:DNA-binding response OmpR family regulator